eukprot:TRINITY_DN7649_c0_g1_i1.p1 TRINITY_DN7649_c0_g1~~TRINITY_DN7649_c0_g1_i1.p1  ORF type:complete len:513 (+),score=71.17 TRINITY_DN7649_c0_g1_i1:34-1539(+)
MVTSFAALITLLALVTQVPAATVPLVATVDNEDQLVYIQKKTDIDAEIVEERARAAVTITGSGLENNMRISFRKNCSDYSAGSFWGQDQFMLLQEVPDSGFYSGQRGVFHLTYNQTHTAYFPARQICIASPGSEVFNSTGIKVIIFEIKSVAGIQVQTLRALMVEKIRAYKYSTVIYVVQGTGLSERMMFSLQYSCKNNGFTVPDLGETPAYLYGVDKNGTSGYVKFSRAQTDLPFDTKDVCVSRGNKATYDFSGFVGVTMTVFQDCIEVACGKGACHQPTGNCLCESPPGYWSICPGESRNVTSYINQTLVKADPKMCKDIKWTHFEPDLAVDQYYLINPSGLDRYALYCDMVDGGWTSIPPTYVQTQYLPGGTASWVGNNFTYGITENRMQLLRNLSYYGKQQVFVNCKSKYLDFMCRRDPYHVIHESYWIEWFGTRLWPIYEFDGCCYWCCYHTDHWRMTTAKFWSLRLPIKNVHTFYGGADANSDELRVEVQAMKFY